MGFENESEGARNANGVWDDLNRIRPRSGTYAAHVRAVSMSHCSAGPNDAAEREHRADMREARGAQNPIVESTTL